MSIARFAAWVWIVATLVAVLIGMTRTEVMSAIIISQIWFAADWLNDHLGERR